MAALATLLGGALLALGAWLPWLTLFAGLQAYSGLTGLYGRLLLAGGAVVTALGVLAWRRRREARGASVLRVGALLAAPLLGLAAWALVGLVSTLEAQAAQPMLVMRMGPGLFVALTGALLAVGAPLLRRR